MAHALTDQISSTLPAGFQQFLDRLITEFDPEQVILFGSRARGEATEDSDTDLLVILPCEGHPSDTGIRIRLSLWDAIDFPVDLMVMTPEVVASRLAANMFGDLVPIAMREGCELYARTF